MEIRLIGYGEKLDHLPGLRTIAEGISEDIVVMIEGCEGETDIVEVSLDYIQTNILVVGVVFKSRPPNKIVNFFSLNLWQVESDHYVFNMQDGKVSGFEMVSLKDYPVFTPVQFVEHILHDLFFGYSS